MVTSACVGHKTTRDAPAVGSSRGGLELRLRSPAREPIERPELCPTERVVVTVMLVVTVVMVTVMVVVMVIMIAMAVMVVIVVVVMMMM